MISLIAYSDSLMSLIPRHLIGVTARHLIGGGTGGLWYMRLECRSHTLSLHVYGRLAVYVY